MGAENQKNYFGQFFLMLTSHSQQHVDVQVIFERCYQNSKWPPEINSNFFCGRKNSKYPKSGIILILQSHFPQYGDVQVIFLGFVEIKNGRHGSISIFLSTQKVKS